MARKTLHYTVEAEGRDQGKTFVITEMPASRAERWAMRCFMAMAQSGVEIPEHVADMGAAGLARMGFDALSRMPYEAAAPLLDEMMTCVTIMPSPSNPSIVRAVIEDDIEEVATRISLRIEILKLHAGFSAAASTSTSGQPAA